MKREVLAAAAILVAAVACTTNSKPPASGNGAAIDAACSDYVRAVCAKRESCSPTVQKERYGDEATCEAREKIGCAHGLGAPSTGDSPDRLEGCVAAYASWSCADWVNGVRPAVCQTPAGSLADGAPCNFSAQCQSAFCGFAPGSGCGKCMALPKAGDSCANLTSCGPGLTCVSGTKTCQVRAAQNASCDKSHPCQVGLSCVGASAQAQGTCQPSVATAGATCDPTASTGPGCFFDAGLYCDKNSKQCTAMPFAGNGQPCGDVSGVRTPCSGGAACVMAQGATSGTCVAAAADGDACDTQKGPPCLAPVLCVVSSGTSGKCAPIAGYCG